MILSGLAIFAGLSVNLVLQFALGVRQAAKGRALPLFQISGLFIIVLFLWIFYSFISIFFSWEFIGLFLLFPLSSLACSGYENLEKRFFPKPKKERPRFFNALTAYDGLVPASLFLTVNLALTFWDAFILSFFFALGCLLAVLILGEINRRSSLEEIPEFLRGIPLSLISMGLLSMIFGSAAWICFRVLDNF